MDNKKLMKKRMKRQMKKQEIKSKKIVPRDAFISMPKFPSIYSNYLDYFNQPENDFFDNGFFLKNSIELNFIDVYTMSCTFYCIFCDVYESVMDHGKVLPKWDYNNIHIDIINKLLIAQLIASNTSNRDPNIIVGELANPVYESDKKFKKIFSIPKTTFTFFLEYINDIKYIEMIDNIDFKHLFDSTNSNYRSKEEIENIKKTYENVKSLFKPKMATFCNLEKIKQISDEEIKRMKKDTSTVIEVRLF